MSFCVEMETIPRVMTTVSISFRTQITTNELLTLPPTIFH